MGTFTLSPRGNVYLQIKSTCEKWSLKQKHDLTLQSPNQHDRKNKVQFRTYNFLLFTGQPQTLGWTEYCFAPNSAVHESTTVTPAELSLGQNLWGPAKPCSSQGMPHVTHTATKQLQNFKISPHMLTTTWKAAMTETQLKQNSLRTVFSRKRQLSFHPLSKLGILSGLGNTE